MSDTLILHITFSELSDNARLPADTLLEVIEHGILSPVSGVGQHDWLFASDMVTLLQKAVRLHQDLEINWQGIALILDLLEERDELLNENAMLRQQLGRFIEPE